MDSNVNLDNFLPRDRHSVIAILERMELMQNLDGKTQEECQRLANETLDFYTPRAEELGLSHEQHLLEELSVKYGYPEDYRELKRLLQESEVMCETTFKTFTLPLRSLLDAAGFDYRLIYRMKSVYSVWRKMRVDHKQFDDVYDLFAARIIYKPKGRKIERIDNLESPENINPLQVAIKQVYAGDIDPEILDCWRIYNIITSIYRLHPDRIKDWVTHPKPSGYQAVQMTAMGPDCTWIEIQIRSERMNEMAEYGIASHWAYKREMSTR